MNSFIYFILIIIYALGLSIVNYTSGYSNSTIMQTLNFMPYIMATAYILNNPRLFKYLIFIIYVIYIDLMTNNMFAYLPSIFAISSLLLLMQIKFTSFKGYITSPVIFAIITAIVCFLINLPFKYIMEAPIVSPIILGLNTLVGFTIFNLILAKSK